VGFDKFDVIPAADLDLSAGDLRRKPANRPGGHLQPVSYTVPMIGTAQRGDDAKALLNKAIAAREDSRNCRASRRSRLKGR
jgi:hypothetical protein